MTRTRKTFAAILATATITGGTIAIAAGPSEASATTCKTASSNLSEVAMCANAWGRANLAPMSDRGVITAGYEYCNIKKLRGVSVAVSSMRSHYGWVKADAINAAAESWFC